MWTQLLFSIKERQCVSSYVLCSRAVPSKWSDCLSVCDTLWQMPQQACSIWHWESNEGVRGTLRWFRQHGWELKKPLLWAYEKQTTSSLRGSQNYQTSMLLPSSVATIPDVVGPVPLSPIIWSKQSKYSRLFNIRSIKKQMTLLIICFLETVRMEWAGMERKMEMLVLWSQFCLREILSPSTSPSLLIWYLISEKELSHWLELNIYT